MFYINVQSNCAFKAVISLIKTLLFLEIKKLIIKKS